MKVHIQDRTYQSFTVDDNINSITINPIKEKLFDQDIFNENNQKIVLLESPTRNMKYLCGILILNGNKTYGKTPNNKKFYYRCIPNNKHLPIFLVPYFINIGFNKSYQNKFILFQFQEWTKDHPIGMIIEDIGDVNKNECYYEYQLYSKSIHHSIKAFIKKTREQYKELNTINKIKEKNRIPLKENENISTYIFSIDPDKSVDFDDALSISTKNENVCITIYLTNVCLLMEVFKLWNFFGENVSTIYLPDRNRIMLPNLLSEDLCSLKQKEERFVLAFSFYFNSKGEELIDKTTIENKTIVVNDNFIYEEEKLHQSIFYQDLFTFTNKIKECQNERIIIKDSHELVAYWMIHTNKYVANYMMLREIGIFRTSHFMNTKSDDKQFQLWRNSCCQYVFFNKDSMLKHETMGINEYIHITSPIRRLVDLLNQWILLNNLFPSFLSLESHSFFEHWSKKLEYINHSMKSIRKVQNDCHIINVFFQLPHIMNTIYEGIVIDKNNGKNVIYIEKLQFTSKMKKGDDHLEINSKYLFRIFLFEREEDGKRKIRLSLYQ